MKELSIEEAVLAWVQGKKVEAVRRNSSDDWIEIDGVGKCEHGKFGQQIFGLPDIYRFRLAPEPPAKKWRPYTRSEIEKRLGVGVQHKGRGYSAIIIAVLEEAVHIGMWNYTFDELLENFKWSDGSPCGVEVDA